MMNIEDKKEVMTFRVEDEYDNSIKEIRYITNTLEGMNIYEFHRFCKKAAYAMGYSNDNIEEVFGEDVYSD